MSTDGPGKVTTGLTYPNSKQLDKTRQLQEVNTGKRRVLKLKGAGSKLKLGPIGNGTPPDGEKRAVTVVNDSVAQAKVPEPVLNMWQRLESGKPDSEKFASGNVKTAYEFDASKVVADTAVRISASDPKLTPYNWVTLGGQKIGIAARGPVTAEDKVQRSVFLKAVLENGCNAIVNLATPLEGVSDYIPVSEGPFDFKGVSVA